MMCKGLLTISLALLQVLIAQSAWIDYEEAKKQFYEGFEDAGILIPRDGSNAEVMFRIPDVPKNQEPAQEETSLKFKSKTDVAPFMKPAFCNDLDCPNFTVVNKFEGYEERLYETSGWVSTSLEGIDLDKATSKMFMKLFDYIEGDNKQEEKIAMTAPVITRIIRGPGPACKNNFTMSFFMSPKVASPPAPSDKAVFLNKLRSQKVYVRSFGGFADKKEWLENAVILAKALKRDGHQFDDAYFYSAGYDSPFKVLYRHNEVWFVKGN